MFVKFLLISHRLQYLGDFQLKNDGLTTKQVLVIIAIEEIFTTPPSISDITDSLSTSRQNIKQIVNQLVKKGFLIIKQDEKDKRVLRVLGTEKNQQYWKERSDNHTRFIKSLFNNIITQEIHTLDLLINKFLNNIDNRYKEVKAGD